MNNRRPNKRKPRQGIAIVEFALLALFLTMATLFTMDLGRIFFAGITLANAAATGAHYAILDEAYATDYDGMEAAALSDAGDLSEVTASASRYCQCPGSAADEACLATDCAGYGESKLYVQVTTQKTFESVFLPDYIYPGGLTVTRTAFLRVR